jgi:hypothetical protein
VRNDSESVLGGGKLKHVCHEDNEVRVTVPGTTVTFSSRLEDAACVLTVEVSGELEASGHELMGDIDGHSIVRVKHDGEQVSLHLENGETLHVLAVANEDGCRVATRMEREHSGGGARSFVDRVLGRE